MDHEEALWTALEAGDAGRVAALLAAEPALAESRNDAGRDLVERALERHDGAMLTALESSGVPVTLVVACALGWVAQAQAALARGDDPNQREAGVSLLERVAEAGRLEVGYALVGGGAECDLHSACSLGLTDLVAYHLEADPRQLRARRRFGGYEPLHCAAECGWPDTVKLLLERGAPVDARTDDGRSAVHLVVYGPRLAPVHSGHPEVLALLLAAGAPLDAVDDQGRDPLATAAHSVDVHRRHGADDALAQAMLATLSARRE